MRLSGLIKRGRKGEGFCLNLGRECFGGANIQIDLNCLLDAKTAAKLKNLFNKQNKKAGLLNKISCSAPALDGTQ